MLELVVLFLLSSVTFFCAHLESPTTNWAYFYASCPIVMGLLSAGLVYINVGFASVQYEYIKYFIFFFHIEIETDVTKNYLKKMTLFRRSVQIKMY